MKKYILLLLLFSKAVYSDLPIGEKISLQVKNKHTKVIVDCFYSFWSPEQREYFFDESRKEDQSEFISMYKTGLSYCSDSKWGSYKEVPKDDRDMLPFFIIGKILSTPVVAKKEQIDRLAQCMIDQSTGIDMIYLIQFIKGDTRYQQDNAEDVKEIVSGLTFSCNAIDNRKWSQESNIRLMEKFYDIVFYGYK